MANSLFIVCSLPIFSTTIEGWYVQPLYNHSEMVPIGTHDKRLDHQAIVVAGWQEPYLPEDPKVAKFWSERLWLAFNWYQRKPVPIYIISSQHPVPQAATDKEKPWAVVKLLEWGVSSENIINLKPQLSTYDAMDNVATKLLKNHIRKPLLVGYPARIKRKHKQLKRCLNRNDSFNNSTVYFTLTDHNDLSVNVFKLESWVPEQKHFAKASQIIHEIFASIGYELLP